MGLSIQAVQQHFIDNTKPELLLKDIKNNLVVGFDNKTVYDKHSMTGKLITFIDNIARVFHIRVRGVDGDQRTRLALTTIFETHVVKAQDSLKINDVDLENMRAAIYRKADLIEGIKGLGDWAASSFPNNVEKEELKKIYPQLFLTDEEKASLDAVNLEQLYKLYKEKEKVFVDALSDLSPMNKWPIMLRGMSLPAEGVKRAMFRSTLISTWSRVFTNQRELTEKTQGFVGEVLNGYAFSRGMSKDSFDCFKVALANTPQDEHRQRIEEWMKNHTNHSDIYSHPRMYFFGGTIGLSKN